MCEAYRGPFHQEYINGRFQPPMLNNRKMTVDQAFQSITAQIQGHEAANTPGSADQKSVEEPRPGPTGETVI